MKNISILFVISTFLLFGCNAEDTEKLDNNPNIVDTKEIKVDKQKALWRKGTVSFLDFEGGFYGIVAENGEKLLPMNLNKQYKQHGTVIKFRGKIIKDMMTTRQWGQAFEVFEVELIKAGHGNNQPTH